MQDLHDFKKALASLMSVHPELARRLAACNPLDVMRAPKHSAISSEAYLAQQQFERVPRLIVLLGIGDGSLLKALLHSPPRWTEWIILVEKDLHRFAAACADSVLHEVLSHPKLQLIVGEDLPAVRHGFFSFFHKGDRYYLAESFAFLLDPGIAAEDRNYYVAAAEGYREMVATLDRGLGNNPFDNLVGFANILEKALSLKQWVDLRPLKGFYQGRPGLVISSGPSLRAVPGLFDFLRANQDKLVLCAADSAVGTLHEQGIVPQFATCIEREKDQAQVFDKLKEVSGTLLISATVVHQACLDRWPEQIALVHRRENLAQWFPFEVPLLPTGPSCGNFSLCMLEYFGCSPIVLLGQDLAFDPHTRSTHFSGCVSQGIVPDYASMQAKGIHKFLPAKGNYLPTVETTDYWHFFKAHLENQIAAFKIPVLNCIPSPYGAAIDGAALVSLRDIPVPTSPLPAWPVRAIEQKELLQTRVKTTEKLSQALADMDTLDAGLASLERKMADLDSAGAQECLADRILALDAQADTLRRNPTYAALLFPIAMSYFTRHIIHSYAVDRSFHGDEVFSTKRKALLAEWLEHTRIWGAQVRKILQAAVHFPE